MSSKEIKCPCCGKTYVSDYDICTVCNWQHDPVYHGQPDRKGGANVMSLNEARAAYAAGKPVK